VLFVIEPVFSKEILVGVYLMITLAIKAFEGMEA